MGREDGGGKTKERKVYGRKYVPLFFVSVASKGLSQAVSLLFATLARRSISVAAQGLRGEQVRREIDELARQAKKGSMVSTREMVRSGRAGDRKQG
jgi:hypothetical protein